MKTKCIHNDLIFYLDNELSVEKRTAVEKHIEECADCRSFLAFLQDGMQIIEKEKNPEVTPFFYTRLSARLDEKQVYQTQSQWSRLAQPAFFSLVLLAGIYGGLKLGSNASSPEVNQPATTSIQMLNDFAAEPIESFLLDEL
ncbi:MAG: zf-HC2 domain-containing protein [Prolixibacteraceae bacterium]|nr:zf-HC2 domain-containing protein [Prolixibacteraceae bacterium]